MGAAGVGAKPTPPRTRRRRCTWLKRQLWRLAWAVAILALLGPHGRNLLSIINDAGGAAVNVVRAAEGVTSSAANLTIAISHLAVGAISVSVSAAEDFCAGVDLHNVFAQRTVVRAGGASPFALELWVKDGAGGAVDNETRAPILAFVRAFNMSVPVQQGSGQVFHAEGKYFSWRCEMRALSSGYFGLAVACPASRLSQSGQTHSGTCWKLWHIQRPGGSWQL